MGIRIPAPLWHSVKGRMIVILLLSSVVPLSLLGGVSYYSFSTFMEKKLISGIQENLEAERAGLDNILKNLNFTSQQLALDRSIAERIHHYMTTDDNIDKSDILLAVRDRMALINYTSPHAGIIALIDPAAGRPFIQNFPTVDHIDVTRYPVLLEANGVTYHAPHLSVDKYNDRHDQVVSLAREVVNYETGTSFIVYIESNFRTLQQLFGNVKYGEPVNHLLLDRDGRIVYDEGREGFPPFASEPYREGRRPGGWPLQFAARGEQGWALAIVMKGDAFRQEVGIWFRNFVTVVLVSLTLSLLLALVGWRSVYRPLHVFRKEIERMGDNQPIRYKRWLLLREFDEVLDRFYRMKERMYDLLREIELREQAKSRVEVEKLRHQINPHFIHNTLNTVQVIAKMNKQEEIVRLITYFTRILHYNLGKDERTHVKAEEEVANLTDYLALQEMRYNHRFAVEIRLDPEAAEFPVPRFMLQPLVENAIYHGFRNRDGRILVEIACRAEGGILIRVEDNGEGMPREKAESLLDDERPEARSSGMGIGLRFVHRLIRSYYGEPYGLRIESEAGAGTVITIVIPERMEESE